MQYYLLLLFFFDGVHGRGDFLIKWAQCQCPVLKYGSDMVLNIINTVKMTPETVSLLSLLWRNVQRNVMRVSLAADGTLTPPSAVYIPRSRHTAAAVTPSASYWSHSRNSSTYYYYYYSQLACLSSTVLHRRPVDARQPQTTGKVNIVWLPLYPPCTHYPLPLTTTSFPHPS